jgi:hypothetical protein
MAFGQITIQSLRQSHKEPLEHGKVRNFARQRAKVVVVEPESLHARQAKQLGRRLRQTHAPQLKTFVRAERASHRLTSTSSASCLTRSSTTPCVVLQRRISSDTGANETTRRTTTVSTQSPRAERTTLKLQSSQNLLSTLANCDAKSQRVQLLTAHCFSGGGGGGGAFKRANSTTLLAASALSRSRSVSRSALLAGSGELGDVELRTHGHRGETAAALALEVVDDAEQRRRAARGSGDGGGTTTASVWPAWTRCGERRDEKEPARARPCVGRSPAALSRASTASLSTALAAAELLGSQRVRERCELRVVKRLARGRSRRAARKRARHAGSDARSAARRPRSASRSS